MFSCGRAVDWWLVGWGRTKRFYTIDDSTVNNHLTYTSFLPSPTAVFGTIWREFTTNKNQVLLPVGAALYPLSTSLTAITTSLLKGGL